MRIAVIGDFHIQNDQYHVTEAAMEDISNCKPDLVVPLGDFGSNDKIGGIEGLLQANDFLKTLDAPLRPILGNHDLQRESGGVQRPGTIQQEFLQMYGLQTTYGVIEEERFRLFFISTDPQPPDSCYQVQECYVSEEQFAWIQKALCERPGVPCIFFSHAPPIGSGLRTVPGVHVRATNAYLDQNHDPYRWLSLIKETPEIVAWFSAHYHLSHVHPDSCTNKYGTFFFTTGVHGSVTRDGNRQSRLIDIGPDNMDVYTIDHDRRILMPTPDWSRNSLSELVNQKTELIGSHPGVRINQSDLTAPSDHSVSCLATCSVGDMNTVVKEIVPLEIDGSRCLVVTDDGFLWEVDYEAEAVMGTLHLGPPLTGAVLSEDGVWRAWGSRLVRSDLSNLMRFERDASKVVHTNGLELEFPVTCLAARPEGGVWVGCGNHLFEIGPEYSNDVTESVLAPVFSLEQTILRLFVNRSKNLTILTEDRKLLQWDLNRPKPELITEDVFDCNGYEEETSSVAWENNQIVHYYHERKGTHRMTLEVNPQWGQDSNVKIYCLGGGYSLILLGGQTYLTNVHENSTLSLKTGRKEVTAVTGIGSSGLLCLAVRGGQSQSSQLQVWCYK